MNKTHTRKFIKKKDGKIIHEQVTRSELSEYASVLIARSTRRKEHQHCVYKLTKCEEKFFWAALWNTCAWTGEFHDSMDDAVAYALDNKWEVKQTFFSELFPRNPMDMDLTKNC